MGEQALELVPLDWTGEATATAAGVAMDGEILSILLQRAVARAASRAADDAPVSAVSVTLDTTGSLPAPGTDTAVAFDTAIDRRTRTLVFAHGAASVAGQTVMTVTAVYRIGAPA